MEERINQEESWAVLNIIYLTIPLTIFFLSTLFPSFFLSFFLSSLFLLSFFPKYPYFLFSLFFLLISYFSIFLLPLESIFFEMSHPQLTHDKQYRLRLLQEELSLTLVITEIRKLKSTKRFLVLV